jgi:hypothetical protein
MMTKVRLFLFMSVLTVILFAGSCRKFEEYPFEPEIAFQDFGVFIDSVSGEPYGVLAVSYMDGDGDIGLEQHDTLPPYQPGGEFYYNLIVLLFEQQYGEMIESQADFSARIPPLIPKDETRSIKGVIEQIIPLHDPNSTFDTIQFQVQLIDRALNKSNILLTPLIIRPDIEP